MTTSAQPQKRCCANRKNPCKTAMMERLQKTINFTFGPHGRWLAFFAAVLAAWGVLYMMQLSQTAYTSAFGSDFWRSLCVTDARLLPLVGMWMLMAAAMMAPTAVPMLRTYNDLQYAGAGTLAGFWALLAGYLVVWAGFAVAAAWGQQQLIETQLVGFDGASTSIWLTAGLLAVAGAYQFTPLKQVCLTACQTPLVAFMAGWKPGAGAAFNMGLKEGLNCLGCCWALMMLGFVGGTMNLAFMGLGMIFMAAEKLPQIGKHISKPMGWLLLAAAAMMIIS